jgi:hypothetical protein
MAYLRTLASHLVTKWALLLVAASFAVVLFAQRQNRHFRPGLPYVYMSDEPHYLVGLNSVLFDGDVELGNNYARVGLGHLDSGINRAGQLIDHHTYVHTFTGVVERHRNLFGSFSDPSDVDASGRRRNRAKHIPESGVLPNEYSWHPTYPFFIVAPLLSLLPRLAVEPVTLLLIAAATFLAALRFRELCMTLVPSVFYADLATIAVFIGTPALFYSRGLFPEGIFLILVVLAYHSCIVRGRWLWPAIALMLAAALKPPAALFAVPALLYMAGRRFWQTCVAFALVSAGALFSFFELRVLKGVLQRGTVVDADTLFDWSCLSYMPMANLFGDRFGLFTFAPVLGVAVVGWVPLAKRFPRESGAILAGVALQFAMQCTIGFYGSSYANRYFVPMLPALGLGLIGIWFYRHSVRRLLVSATIVLLFISALINFRGAIVSI